MSSYKIHHIFNKIFCDFPPRLGIFCVVKKISDFFHLASIFLCQEKEFLIFLHLSRDFSYSKRAGKKSKFLA